MTPDRAFRLRMALARQIRATLAEALPDASAAARWLRAEAAQIVRDAARRANNPVERFPIDPDSPEALL